jgi:hypothetical protein
VQPEFREAAASIENCGIAGVYANQRAFSREQVFQPL